jgi:hypothetical protein
MEFKGPEFDEDVSVHHRGPEWEYSHIYQTGSPPPKDGPVFIPK